MPHSARTLSLSAVVALSLTAASTRADIYQYTDADGIIHFSNTEKKGKVYAKSAEPVKASAGGSFDSKRFDEHIKQAAALYQIPEELVRAVIRVESGFDPRAVSRT